MKAKCIKIFSDYDEKYINKSSSLTVGKEYIVLEVAVGADEQMTYRLVSDSGTPAIFKALQFEVVSELVPSNWKVSIQKEYGAIDISPAAWRENDFWGAFFDDEPWAKEVYEKELAIIYSEK